MQHPPLTSPVDGHEHSQIPVPQSRNLSKTVFFYFFISEQFFDFFKYVEVSTFDIASDAFASFKVHSVNLTLSFCNVNELPFLYMSPVSQYFILKLTVSIGINKASRIYIDGSLSVPVVALG